MSALSMPKGGQINGVLLGLAIIAMLMVLGASAAFAGTDTTFNTALTKFTDFLEGSGGKIITVMSLAGGIVALASGRFSLGQVAVPVAVGVGAGTGIPIVTSTVTATI
ncbi:hypothetical protein EDF69_003681 [Sphingomonas sp. JUb134]|uniref:Conjugal transfer pilus assembly protein TraA n=2 Tax=Sphingomonadaceae TaxID=41297 RepID=A0ABU8QAE6_9SPHN|nr:hypothetical protein [Sphingomonas sp. JUb134]MBM7408043.1 hypothetical protein [Sphingomonas sp. JUb134]